MIPNLKRVRFPQPSPQISRKIRACTECKGHKIKCHLPPGSAQCTRCHRLKLDCVVNKSLQTLLEDESHWKNSMEQKTDEMQKQISLIFDTLKMLPGIRNELPAVRFQTLSPQSDSLSPGMNRRGETIRMAMTRENSAEPVEQKDGEDGSLVPMNNLYEVTRLRNLRSSQNQSGKERLSGEAIMQEDFISRGAVPLQEAEELFERFNTSMNQFLWGGVALKHANLTSVRKSSSLLAAVILTVAALHIPGHTQIFDTCYAEFNILVSDSVLDRYHVLDEVRALCIGAFYLSDVSWKLSGLAVRIATELNLHQAYSQALRGVPGAMERAQLWYILYVCDHHFSIAYGRPPSIHEDISISGLERFLSLPGVEQADVRLYSQVALFQILTRIYHSFGSQADRELSEMDMPQLRHFNADLDAWKNLWYPRLQPSTYIASYPAKGVILHYNFSKLQLNSLAFRKIANHPLSADRRELANIAISSATTTLNLVLDELDINNALVGVPLYLHAMIAFAALFLLKVASKWKTIGAAIDARQVDSLVERTIVLMQNAVASDRHLTYHIAGGLSKRLQTFREWEKSAAELDQPNEMNGMPIMSNGVNMFGNGDANSFGSVSQGVYGMYNGDASAAFMEPFEIEEQYFPSGVFDFVFSQMPE